ncbi:MAG TPA: TlyA family RNA methyltransferase [Solirubrobacterales bacterium]|nr:TlyA family RNA methyltransferase [Solirubrobacterales bacterium]
MPKQRADVLLVERGLFESRAKAAAAVIAGQVQIGSDGRKIDKPGQMLDAEVVFKVAERDRYVSRGGIKLENALKAFPQVEIAARDCLDAGASTGGFTDYLLQHGANHVVAVDVAYGELHWSLREHNRVTVVERRNVRELTPEELPYGPELIVADLSFISLTKVLPALVACASSRFDMLALVKPQFEVGRERVGKGGVVRDRAARVDAIVQVAEAAIAAGASVQGVTSSGLPGPAGNLESFIWLAERERVAAGDPRALAEASETKEG